MGGLYLEAVLFRGSRSGAGRFVLYSHAHPTLAEAVHEAALSVDRRAIHAVNK
jgi:dihydrolipoamide dehydrogenase